MRPGHAGVRGTDTMQKDSKASARLLAMLRSGLGPGRIRQEGSRLSKARRPRALR